MDIKRSNTVPVLLWLLLTMLTFPNGWFDVFYTLNMYMSIHGFSTEITMETNWRKSCSSLTLAYFTWKLGHLQTVHFKKFF